MATYGKANCIYLPCVSLIFCWNRCSWLTWYCRYVTKPNNTRLNGTTNCFTLWMKKTNNFLPHWQSRLCFFWGLNVICYLLYSYSDISSSKTHLISLKGVSWSSLTTEHATTCERLVIRAEREGPWEHKEYVNPSTFARPWFYK